MDIETITLEENAECNENKEWRSIQEQENCRTVIKPRLFIMECGQLVPFLEGDYVRFFPINMPKVRIDCIDLIGLILEVSRNSKQYELVVDDGTGILDVVCNLKHLKAKPKENQEEDLISADCSEDKGFVVGNYVYLQGYLSLHEYNKSFNNCDDKVLSKRFAYGHPVFYAVNVEFISEKQYYMKMHAWLKSAKKRYV